ncbi:MAG: 3-methyladenine DNA glycosylase [Actinomycetales bacterium mxb001]|nr:MAG: 3-methyladenine DNA glycosylase [Actinomycetales bacterium mxb001]
MTATLDEGEWRARQHAHAERIRPWIEPRLERRRRGERHPVDDFLFEYYSFRPGQLATWHPGAGIELTGDVREWESVRGYVVRDGRALVDPAEVPIDSLRAFAHLLRQTTEREPQYGCFGRHEWAMVYRLGQDEVRHSTWPLRVTPAQIAEVVESSPLKCTHFDAFRFYSPAARPLNVVTPTRATQAELEQPGCLHATMDLYKWAFRSYPIVGAELTADCFALARDVRDVDMRVAPYDLTALGLEPLPIETPEGRAEFVRHQRAFAERGARLRDRVLRVIESALAIPQPA